MAPPPVELTKGEERVQTAGVAFISFGSIGAGAISTATRTWWPVVVYALVALTLIVGMAAHLARTRHQPFWSTLLLGLPERLRARRHR